MADEPTSPRAESGPDEQPIKQRKNGLYPGVSDELAENMTSGWADTELRDLEPHAERSRRTLRQVGLGGQILSDLSIRKIRLLTNTPTHVPALQGFDLEIVEDDQRTRLGVGAERHFQTERADLLVGGGDPLARTAEDFGLGGRMRATAGAGGARAGTALRRSRRFDAADAAHFCGHRERHPERAAGAGGDLSRA